MDKNTLFSSFGKWVTPINVLNIQQKVDELQQDKYCEFALYFGMKKSNYSGRKQE